MEKILNEIKAERARQNNKWGEQNHSVIEWQAILSEEVGEAAREAVDYHFGNGLNSKDDSLSDDFKFEIQKQRLFNYRKELIEVAAVAVQMIECLDRNELLNFKDVLND